MVGIGYVQSANTTAPVLPNTSGEMMSIVAVVTLAVGVAVILTTVARQLAKKHYSA